MSSLPARLPGLEVEKFDWQGIPKEATDFCALYKSHVQFFNTVMRKCNGGSKRKAKQATNFTPLGYSTEL